MEQGKKISGWALQERPRERLASSGASVLTNAELIAILLRNGTTKATAVDLGRELLAQHENSLHLLLRAPLPKLESVKGIGPAKAAVLCAAFELGRRAQLPQEPLELLTSAHQIAQLMIPLVRDLPYETCWVLFLGGGRNLLGKEMVSSGGINATHVDVRLILKMALERLACEIVLVHNHPSGNPTPGKADRMLTGSLREAAKLVEIGLLDHVVIGGNKYYSFAEQGLL